MSYFDAQVLDRHAYLDSPVHRLDPRAKVLATFAFVIAVVSHDKYALAPLAPFVLYPLLLAVIGFVPASLLARRLLAASPFVLVIGIFNPLFDRAPLLALGPWTLSGGWVSFFSIALRGYLCVAAAIALIATTSIPRIAEALRALGVPRVMVVQLLLLYRYLFLLAGEAGRMNRARALKAGGRRATLGVAGSMLSVLMMRTLDRAEAVWLAMKARGFEGELLTARRMEWRPADSLFLAAVVAGCVALRIYPVAAMLGRWLGAA